MNETANLVAHDDIRDDAVPSPSRPDDETLTLSFESWEGPLDLLLTLARGQKVDLREISILALVEQYLVFIENAQALKLEVAADYLVMAAWLAYLKSALLLPKAEQPDPSPEELALRLQLRLQRLDAMRDAGARLMGRDLMGRDVFARGTSEGLHRPKASVWQASLYDLMQAYGQVKARNRPVVHMVAVRNVMTLETAIERVAKMVGSAFDWTVLESFLPDSGDPELRRSARASSFVAALELAKQRRLDIKQAGPFAPLYLRAATSAGQGAAE
ncbi:MAG TPA: ScpA family protein [Sphingobium sp.]|uniref:segregation and condensation protein A n=1 Tax=Sphingobium sp. TaxID=1912891 RepID=UPI002ED61550